MFIGFQSPALYKAIPSTPITFFPLSPRECPVSHESGWNTCGKEERGSGPSPLGGGGWDCSHSPCPWLTQDSDYVVAVRNFLPEDPALLAFHKGDIIHLQPLEPPRMGQGHGTPWVWAAEARQGGLPGRC